MSVSPVDSPCVRSCCLDQNDICMGCGRSLDEIRDWQQASDASKQEILVTAAARREQRQRILLALRESKI